MPKTSLLAVDTVVLSIASCINCFRCKFSIAIENSILEWQKKVNSLEHLEAFTSVNNVFATVPTCKLAAL